MVNSWTIAEYQVMADMKKVYNDLIIINLYVLCFLLESYQNTECPSVEGLCHEGFEWYETGRYIGGTLAFFAQLPNHMLLKADKALTFCDCWLLALSLWYTKKVDIFFFFFPSSWLFWAKADLRTIPDSLQKFRIEIIIIAILHQYMSISYPCINLGSIYPWKTVRLCPRL